MAADRGPPCEGRMNSDINKGLHTSYQGGVNIVVVVAIIVEVVAVIVVVVKVIIVVGPRGGHLRGEHGERD